MPCGRIGHPPVGGPPCLPTCIGVGTIGVPYVRGQAHASALVCDSPAHQEETHQRVESITGQRGTFGTFEQARAEARARSAS